MSASTISTLAPNAASARARFQATVVLPSPGLAEVTSTDRSAPFRPGRAEDWPVACGRPRPPAVRERRCPDSTAQAGGSGESGRESVVRTRPRSREHPSSVGHAARARSRTRFQARGRGRHRSPCCGPGPAIPGTKGTSARSTWRTPTGATAATVSSFRRCLSACARSPRRLGPPSPPGRVVSGICESSWWTAWRSCFISWVDVCSRSAMYSWATASAMRAARLGSVSVAVMVARFELRFGDHVDASGNGCLRWALTLRRARRAAAGAGSSPPHDRGQRRRARSSRAPESRKSSVVDASYCFSC